MMEEVIGTVLISFRNNVIIKNKQLHIYSSLFIAECMQCMQYTHFDKYNYPSFTPSFVSSLLI
jgi:hypothetical protein